MVSWDSLKKVAKPIADKQAKEAVLKTFVAQYGRKD
jgi:hypothetical protein|tara:strand:- start:31 stop:138 length:108 start_codon:yes stop_codon:yes gene_type:complete